jgi:hypothetical protein
MWEDKSKWPETLKNLIFWFSINNFIIFPLIVLVTSKSLKVTYRIDLESFPTFWTTFK